MPITFVVRRASVCMADDVDAPHEQRFSFDLPASEEDVALGCVRRAVAASYLPSVVGGSTWIAQVADRPVAVVTRDYLLRSNKVRPTGVRPDIERAGEIYIYFDYYLSNAPDRLLAELAAGKRPEARQGDGYRT